MHNLIKADNRLNYFLKNISIKKQYINKLKSKFISLHKIKTPKNILTKLNVNKHLSNEDYLIKYIVDITFSRTNTLLHVMDFSGNLKFSCSAGTFQFKGKNKTVRRLIIKEFYKIMLLKLKFLKSQPLALNLTNIYSSKFWIIKLLKKKFYVKVVKVFHSYTYNGCRKKKFRRKKFRTKSKKRRNG